jgi:hypothetical protein
MECLFVYIEISTAIYLEGYDIWLLTGFKCQKITTFISFFIIEKGNKDVFRF